MLARSLTRQQIQMIALGGTIGSGLFLGLGKALSTGGPGSTLIAYSIVGLVVYLTMLCLGEMSAYMPIAGSFTTYATRFVDEGFGFALTWNYWFNDAVSVAGDLTAFMMLLEFWGHFPSWIVALCVLGLLVLFNYFGVKIYGVVEYWLSILKVVTIILYIIIGIAVNCGANTKHDYLGFYYWTIPGAPFVNGFGGFLSVFVSAAFSFGGTESIGVTAGETENPRYNLPRVIRNVFWRVLLFYVVGNLVTGIDVPYDHPSLSGEKNSRNSPFTLVFQLAGIDVAAHIMNAVIITSVISAGNHALFAGTRLLFALSQEGHAHKVFGKLSPQATPVNAMLLTTLIASLCFSSSFVGHGRLWNWIQSLVGVSNQIAWVSIGWSNWRFRRAFKAQGMHLSESLPFRSPFGTWAPLFVVFVNCAFILLQGWTSVIPNGENWTFSFPDFLSFYLEIPVLAIMWLGFRIVRKSKVVPLPQVDLATDKYEESPEDLKLEQERINRPLWKRIFEWIL